MTGYYRTSHPTYNYSPINDKNKIEEENNKIYEDD
jgi:hypothetical protein